MCALNCHLKLHWNISGHSIYSTHTRPWLHTRKIHPAWLWGWIHTHFIRRKVRHSERWGSRAGICTYSREGHILCHRCLCAVSKWNYSTCVPRKWPPRAEQIRKVVLTALSMYFNDFLLHWCLSKSISWVENVSQCFTVQNRHPLRCSFTLNWWGFPRVLICQLSHLWSLILRFFLTLGY